MINAEMMNEEVFASLWRKLHDMLGGKEPFLPHEALLITSVCAEYMNNHLFEISDSLWLAISQDARWSMLSITLAAIPKEVLHHMEKHMGMVAIPTPGVN